MKKNLKRLMDDLGVKAGTVVGARYDDLKKIIINKVVYDSRQVEKGSLFVAVPGQRVDGHNYVADAVKKGAAALVVQKNRPNTAASVPVIRVSESRRTLADLAASFYDYPACKLKTIGVTGTDGKSTTVWLIHQLLTALGRKGGFLSTVSFDSGRGEEKNSFRQSTPEAPEIHAMLARMVANGCSYAVIEATSHGLSAKTRRLSGLEFDAAVFTNISHEHLEFHGSFEQYRADKARLFGALNPETGFGVINLDHLEASFFEKVAAGSCHTYSRLDGKADLTATEIQGQADGSQKFTLSLKGQRCRTQFFLPGLYNIENLLAACLTVARLTGCSLGDIAPLLPALSPVKGRMQSLNAGQPFKVIVDYAHSPGSFSKVLPQVAAFTSGRLMVVFGSAGERDVEKRAMQGSIADRHSDVVVLADEDPRGEDALSIIEEIAAGVQDKVRGRSLFIEPDRQKAIELAFSLARPGDTVLLLGKAHEASIIYADGPLAWDEAEAAWSALAKLGFVKR